MSDKLTEYKKASQVLPELNRLWPLYGAGFENLGKNREDIKVPMPSLGHRELLIRHDACGLCFSDIKVLTLGNEHPRITRDMRKEAVVLGHEVSLTVVRVGEDLRSQYKIGDRFIVQADIYVKGVNLAYGYMIQGGLSQYSVIDERILNGDDGNYLIPVRPNTGYAESALTEPWACVIAAYQLKYRTGLKAGGSTWIVGTKTAAGRDYLISSGFEAKSHPAQVLLTDVPASFSRWIKDQAMLLGVEVFEVEDPSNPPIDKVDDIVLLGAESELIETLSPYLASHGIFAILSDKAMPRPISLDIGRIHYDRWVYVAGKGLDISQAYSRVPVRSTLRPNGKAWFVGAAGPMGRMHVLRAVQIAECPSTILCTDLNPQRLEDMRISFEEEAQAKGIEFICLNPSKTEDAARLKSLKNPGFDDIIVLAPVPAIIGDAASYLAPYGVMNIFAGVARGTMAQVDLSNSYLKDTRIIGHSASSIDDLRLMLSQAESGTLSPNRSVAAVGSLSAAYEGLKATKETKFPGKIVIYPMIKDFPLTAISDLGTKLPSVYERLRDGREWTNEAEEEFLRLMLP